MINLLLLGHRGMIGNQLTEYFKEKKDSYNLICVDNSKNFNLKSRTTIQNLLKKNKDINFILNCTGLNHHVKTEGSTTNKFDTDIHLLDKYMQINVKSVCWLIEDGTNLLPNLKGVLNFSSLYGIMSPYHPAYKEPKSLSYTLSKHALEGVTKYYATLLGPKGIKVNSVRIGGIKTNNQPKDFIDWFVSRTPMGRMAEVNDLFGVIELLCSDKSSYITGQNFTVDGGLTAW